MGRHSTEDDPRLKVAAGRYLATQSWPYLATGLCALVLRESDKVETMATTRHWVTTYNPAWVQARTVEELAASLVHELYHLLYMHFDRMPVYAPVIRNLAGDCEINDHLGREAKLPADVIYPSTFKLPDDQTAEFYAEKLDAQAVKIKVPGLGQGSCGSCADGQGEPGEADDPEAMKPVHGDLVRGDVARAVEDHVRNQGTVPAGLQRWASRWLTPRVDWRAALRATLRSAVQYTLGCDDYVWTRPNRRQAAFGNVRHPAMRAPLPSVGILIDTSGSMTDTDLSRAMTEVRGVLDVLQVPVRVWSCDTEVSGGQAVASVAQVRMQGGGGTDMVHGLAVMETARPRPDVAVVITDGYTPWPEHKPPFAAIVIVKTQAQGASPAWGKTIVVEDDNG